MLDLGLSLLTGLCRTVLGNGKGGKGRILEVADERVEDEKCWLGGMTVRLGQSGSH